jgi:alpha-ketoglutarate-dependent taurine dioxygenase
VYSISEPEGTLDLGVRLSVEVEAKLAEAPALDADFVAAVSFLVRTSRQGHLHHMIRLEAGDMLVLDNNRVAHGRYAVHESRMMGRMRRTNTRELWSCTVG